MQIFNAKDSVEDTFKNQLLATEIRIVPMSTEPKDESTIYMGVQLFACFHLTEETTTVTETITTKTTTTTSISSTGTPSTTTVSTVISTTERKLHCDKQPIQN